MDSNVVKKYRVVCLSHRKTLPIGKGFFVVDPVVIRKSGIFTLCQIIDFSYSHPTPKRAHYCHLVCNITKEGGYGVLVKNALLSIIRNRGRGDFYMANRDPGADPRSA